MGHARFLLCILLGTIVAGCLSVGPPPGPRDSMAPDGGDYYDTGRPPRDLVGKVIVVDAGHGGRDLGAPGVGPVPEKIVNLEVARRLAALLKRRGATVVMTRTTDVFVELDDRAATADRVGADLLVSVHSDACARPHVTGPTMYVARRAYSSSVRAAEHAKRAFDRAGIPCRDVRRADFRVLVGHGRPAMLVECGYMTNPGEARQLATSTYQWKLAHIITQGISDHLGERQAK